MDSSKQITRVFIPEFLDMNRNGRKVLSSLRILITGRLTSIRTKSTKLETTMKKSRMFQYSRKYEYLSMTKPKATALIKASREKRIVKTISN